MDGRDGTPLPPYRGSSRINDLQGKYRARTVGIPWIPSLAPPGETRDFARLQSGLTKNGDLRLGEYNKNNTICSPVKGNFS